MKKKQLGKKRLRKIKAEGPCESSMSTRRSRTRFRVADFIEDVKRSCASRFYSYLGNILVLEVGDRFILSS
ncbi:hypothetical protein GOP47_0025415 [Adiantum capillus-veneris]|uniref:Uncharacterized protein n=1 Tax=Adiantum capillus-veneris TaxID=13818 RepID=A0A9D4Z435_ADICA|nr:hypothetical protein GOP47_0025415 [Adiantum capillus-veneris]